MAAPHPRVVSLKKLRFWPANSNERARAGVEHEFNNVPQCAFAKDDGISSYLHARAGIDSFPDNPATHEPVHDDIPAVTQDRSASALCSGHRLIRSGFGLSIFLHGLIAITIAFAGAALPRQDALLEGETVIAVEFFSETDSEVTTRIKQEEQDGNEEAVEKPKDEPTPDISKEEPRRVEQAALQKPVAGPVDKPIEQAVMTDQPEVLSTREPSSFQIEAATQQILENNPLPDSLPPLLSTPAEEKKPEPEKKLAQPLKHPVSKLRVVQKVAAVKPAERLEEKPVVKKEEPRRVQKRKPELKPEKTDKKTKARDGNAETQSNKGNSRADKKKGESQDASQGNSKRKLKGNAAASNYKGLVQRKLERAKKRVRVAATGTAIVSFTISSDGSVVNLRVRKSSGKPAVDKAALEIVRRASPFPAISDEAGLNSYPVSVPMTFKGN